MDDFRLESAHQWSLGWMVRRIARDVLAGHCRIHVSPWHMWRAIWRGAFGARAGLFRNKPGVVGFRWGFYVLGFEVGNRKVGLWPEDRPWLLT